MKENFKKAKMQGDVQILPVSELPSNLKKLEGVILQQSEITGHHHRFLPDANVELFETSDVALTTSGENTITPDHGKYIVVHESTPLYHGKEFQDKPSENGTGDHNSMIIEPGVYKVNIVREYDYESQEARAVID